jgi:hypothetical protein
VIIPALDAVSQICSATVNVRTASSSKAKDGNEGIYIIHG